MSTIEELMPEGPDYYCPDEDGYCTGCARYPHDCNNFTAEDCGYQSLFIPKEIE